MRSSGNFHPEWGYLAPAPSVMRTVRVVLVATAVGATAGAGVVLSLVERPASDVGASTASHMLVTSVEAATPPVIIAAAPVNKPVPRSAPVNVAAQEQTPVQPRGDAQPAARPAVANNSVTPPRLAIPAAAPAVNEASTSSTPDAPTSVAALAEVPPATTAMPTLPAQVTDEAALAPDAAPGQKKATKKHSAQRGEPGYWPNAKGQKNGHGLAPILRRLFSARTSSSYYQN